MGLKFNNTKILYEEITKTTVNEGKIEYSLIEYPDYLINGSIKVKSKNLGDRFASINSFFFEYLKEFNIPSAFIKKENLNTLKFLKIEPFPFSIKILNSADKRNSRLFGLKESQPFNIPLIEIRYGNGNDNLITESHLVSLELCSIENLKLMYRLCSKVNAIIRSFFERRSVYLAEITCNFGKLDDKIYLVNDFTPLSIKILPVNSENGFPNPYKLVTSLEIKQYTEHLFTITRA